MTPTEPPSPRLLGLLHGERLLWSGRPDPNVWFGPMDALIIPFTMLWAGFAVFWNVGVWHSHGPVFFRIWGIPFLLVGAYALVGRFFVKHWRKVDTEYALTPRRAIVLDRRGNVTDVPLATAPISRRSRRDGSHLSVTFGSAWAPARFGIGWGYRRAPANYGLDPFHTAAPGFFDVADVDGLDRALAQVDRS